MRRTDDGIHPLEVADGGKKFARPNIQEFHFLIVLKFYVLGEKLQIKGPDNPTCYQLL